MVMILKDTCRKSNSDPVYLINRFYSNFIISFKGTSRKSPISKARLIALCANAKLRCNTKSNFAPQLFSVSS